MIVFYIGVLSTMSYILSSLGFLIMFQKMNFESFIGSSVKLAICLKFKILISIIDIIGFNWIWLDWIIEYSDNTVIVFLI